MTPPESYYQCHTPSGRHRWPKGFDADNWQRCAHGCGCGRPRMGKWPGAVYEPDEVPAPGPTPNTPESPQARSERNLCVSDSGWHSWPVRLDADGWLRCQRAGCEAGKLGAQRSIVAHAPAFVAPAFTLDDEGWTPLPTYAHEPLRPDEVGDCVRCGARELVERDLDGDFEFVCINGHRRYRRTQEQLAAVLKDDVDRWAGYQRKREPRSGNVRLG